MPKNTCKHRHRPCTKPAQQTYHQNWGMLRVRLRSWHLAGMAMARHADSCLGLAPVPNKLSTLALSPKKDSCYARIGR